MKILLDFLPILLFFGTFKYAESHKDWAAAFATEHLGFLVDGGIGLMLLFTLAQGLYISRHLPAEDKTAVKDPG